MCLIPMWDLFKSRAHGQESCPGQIILDSNQKILFEVDLYPTKEKKSIDPNETIFFCQPEIRPEVDAIQLEIGPKPEAK